MDIGRLINWILTLGMALATVGLLYEATTALKGAAMDTHQHGMISLGAFNRRLQLGK